MQTSPRIAEPLDQLTLDEAVDVFVRPVDEAGSDRPRSRMSPSAASI